MCCEHARGYVHACYVHLRCVRLVCVHACYVHNCSVHTRLMYTWVVCTCVVCTPVVCVYGKCMRDNEKYDISDSGVRLEIVLWRKGHSALNKHKERTLHCVRTYIYFVSALLTELFL